jgi:hypothetical protein
MDSKRKRYPSHFNAARMERDRVAYQEHRRSVVPFGYPTSGNPNIIGEHEVAPVRCPCCNHALPWALIKGWRN